MKSEILKILLNPVIATILIIFGTTALLTIFQRRARDPCLKKFRDCTVYVQLKSGEWIHGVLHVFSKSLEIVYEKPRASARGHEELSHVLFEDMLPQVQVVIRPTPEAGTVELHRWQKELQKIISPSIWFDIRRSFRNVFNTLRDAFSQTLGVAVSQLRTRHPATILAGADQKLTAAGQILVGPGNNAYEPILEKYLGKRVVVEMLVAEKWIDHLGVLEEYSDKYLLIRDVELSQAPSAPEELKKGNRVDVAFSRGQAVARHLAG
jgi:small nuclear ribonucleoprotein (snRNP)-like protein